MPMAFRSRSRFTRARGPRKRAVWCNIPFVFTFSETAGNQVLLVPEDWEASFTALQFEKATLRAVRGVVWWHQTAAGTLATAACYWGIYKTAIADTAAPVWTVTGMGTKDWLHTDSFAVQGTLSGTNAAIQRRDMDIKTKRKLTSQDSLYICGQIGADAASPTVNVGGILRFLVARD
jgi:hypothetical protein